MNASPCTAGDADHATPNFSVDIASENNCWANWRMGRGWAPLPLELPHTPGQVWVRGSISPLLQVPGWETSCMGSSDPAASHLPSREPWTFRPPAISPGCLSDPESLNFLDALSFAASAWHRVCKGNSWLSHESAFCSCTLTFMQEHIWRFKTHECFQTESYISQSNPWRNAFQRNVFLKDREPHVSGALGKSKAISNLRTVLLTYSNFWKISHIFLVSSPCPHNGVNNTSNLIKVWQISILKTAVSTELEVL